MTTFQSQIHQEMQLRFDRAKPHFDRFEEYAKSLGATVRSFGFAGLALVWIFREQTAGALTLPTQLQVAGFFFVLGLALDLVRLLFGAIESEILGRVAFLGEAASAMENRAGSLIARVRPARFAVLLETGCVLAGFLSSLLFLYRNVR